MYVHLYSYIVMPPLMTNTTLRGLSEHFQVAVAERTYLHLYSPCLGQCATGGPYSTYCLACFSCPPCLTR